MMSQQHTGKKIRCGNLFFFFPLAGKSQRRSSSRWETLPFSFVLIFSLSPSPLHIDPNSYSVRFPLFIADRLVQTPRKTQQDRRRLNARATARTSRGKTQEPAAGVNRRSIHVLLRCVLLKQKQSLCDPAALGGPFVSFYLAICK